MLKGMDVFLLTILVILFSPREAVTPQINPDFSKIAYYGSFKIKGQFGNNMLNLQVISITPINCDT